MDEFTQDELPQDLRAMLELARDAHDPSDATAQGRVRVALAAALGVPATGAALSKASAMSSQAPAAMNAAAAKTGGWFAGTKLAALAAGTLAAAGIGIAVYRMQAPTAEEGSRERAVPAVQPQVEPALPPQARRTEPALSAAPAEAPEVAEAPAAPGPAQPEPAVQVSRPAKKRADTLGREMVLLRTASEALQRGEYAAALAPLRVHARTYPQGRLREERDGLRAIIECSRPDQPSHEAARRFGKLYPSSLLAARVAAACKPR